jgi:hypothetical protein
VIPVVLFAVRFAVVATAAAIAVIVVEIEVNGSSIDAGYVGFLSQ